MQLGIFSRTFARPTVAETFAAVASHGVHHIQFKFPAEFWFMARMDYLEEIKQQLAANQLTIQAISGTFNMIHPNLAERNRGFSLIQELVSACSYLDVPVITLCTGTNDPNNMWKHHPENRTQQSWRELVNSMVQVLDISEASGVTLAFEPEANNVVNSAQKARQLLAEMQSPRLKVVMDGANLLIASPPNTRQRVLEEAFQSLGEHIAVVHLKDFTDHPHAEDVSAGSGLLDFEQYLQLVTSLSFAKPLIAHGFSEENVPKSLTFLQRKLRIK